MALFPTTQGRTHDRPKVAIRRKPATRMVDTRKISFKFLVLIELPNLNLESEVIFR